MSDDGDDDRLAALEAAYRETGAGNLAREAYAWARDASDPPSREIPEWVLQYLDRTVAAIQELDARVRADMAAGRQPGAKRARPKHDPYFRALATALDWNPWPLLKAQERAAIVRQVEARQKQTRPRAGGGRHDRQPAGISKNKARAQTAHAFNLTVGRVKQITKQGKKRR